MASKGAAASPSTPNAKEALFFKTILAHVKVLPDIDWDAVAAESGYANGSTAKKRYQQIKTKLGWGADYKSSPSPGKTRVSAKKGVGSGMKGTPSKVVKGRARKLFGAGAPAAVKKVKDEEVEDDEYEEGVKVEGESGGEDADESGNEEKGLKEEMKEEEDEDGGNDGDEEKEERSGWTELCDF